MKSGFKFMGAVIYIGDIDCFFVVAEYGGFSQPACNPPLGWSSFFAAHLSMAWFRLGSEDWLIDELCAFSHPYNSIS